MPLFIKSLDIVCPLPYHALDSIDFGVEPVEHGGSHLDPRDELVDQNGLFEGGDQVLEFGS